MSQTSPQKQFVCITPPPLESHVFYRLFERQHGAMGRPLNSKSGDCDSMPGSANDLGHITSPLCFCQSPGSQVMQEQMQAVTAAGMEMAKRQGQGQSIRTARQWKYS